MKKRLSLLTSSALLLTMAFPGIHTYAQSNNISTATAASMEEVTTPPIDMAIANEERLIEMLKKSGKIPTNASKEESQKIVRSYLSQLGQQKATGVSQLDKEEKKVKSILKNQQQKNGLQQGKQNKLNQNPKNLPSVKEEKWTGSTREDKVLVLLIEFPDFLHNSIKSEDTDMYYSDYTKQHYQDMIFGKNGYTGPDGKNLLSVKQYYEQQSGGSYTINGTVAGWYKAPQPAAYYGAHAGGSNDARPRSLVAAALRAAAQDPSINLKDYDQEDRYDLDGDGNYREPDGIIDHLMVVHSSVGEEAGGGQLGTDAIWSHRWNLGGVYAIPGSSANADYWGGAMGAYDYTIEPADGATGVFAHEFGHDLGLPDEYDTQYSGAGEAIEYWSIMSAGSWAGKIPGTEPTGFSPYAREYLQNSMDLLAGKQNTFNWLKGSQLSVTDLGVKKSVTGELDQASSKGTNNDVIRVDLPKKIVTVNKPKTGSYEYYSTKGDDISTSMTTTVDLTNATTAQLSFQTWYQIEKDFDYASVAISTDNGTTYTQVQTNLSTTTNPYDQNPGYGITGSSSGWVEATADLSAFIGKKVTLKFNYWTDGGVALDGFFVDDVKVTTDKGVVLEDGAETPTFDLTQGFVQTDGTTQYTHYYLLEWRNQTGVDQGLGHILRGNSLMSYDSGLTIWYVDNSYTDNWTGIHPGEGFLSVVDADQKGLLWSNGLVASSRYQVHDAAFGLQPSLPMFIDYSTIAGRTITDNLVNPTSLFDDSLSYINPTLPDSGVKVPNYGLKVKVTGESKDRTVGQVTIYR